MDRIHVCLMCCLIVTIRGLVGVLPTLDYKHVVAGQPGVFCLWRLETERYSWSPGLPLFCHSVFFFSHMWSVCISSQIVPVHSPLISSIVDFVFSSYPAHNYSFFTVWSPLRSELCVKFFLSGRLFFAQHWCIVDRVRKSGVFVTVNSINSVYSLLFLRSGWVWTLCFLPRSGQRRFVTCVSFCNLCRQVLSFWARFLGVILVFFGGTCRELTLWSTFTEL